MKRLLVLIILLTSTVSALQFSPTELTFDLKDKEIDCKTISFNIETPTTITDIWADNSNEEWSISKFKTSSNELGISASYPSEINPNENKIELCLQAENSGDYKGALLFKQEQLGNSQIQFAVWLKVHSEVEEQTTSKPSSKSSSSKSSGSSSSGIIWTSDKPETQTNFQNINYQTPKEEIQLNSKLTKQNTFPTSATALTTITLCLMIILLIVLLRR